MVDNSKRKIIKYETRKGTYHKSNRKVQEGLKRPKKDYYVESMSALVSYLKNNVENPNENKWNHYAVENDYLSSKSIGYLSKINFNTLCRKLRKQINHEKRQKN